MPVLQINGVSTAVETRGDAARPALLLLHGGVTGNIGHHYWELHNIAERLAEDFFVVTYDRRGHGETPFTGTLDDVALDVIGAMDALGLKEASVLGLSAILPNAVAGMGLTGGLFTVFVIVTVTLLMSDVTSNTATAAISIPIVISIINGIGLNPIPYIYIASIGINLSYMLPTSIRAIPVGYGLQPKYMLSEGWKLTIVIILSMTALSYALLKLWPAFSAA